MLVLFPTLASARSGDPRKSIAERYKGRDDYLKRFGAALDELIRQRYVLEEDRGALMKLAEQEWELVSK